MARATLAFRDLDDDMLPNVCAKCGAPATTRKSKHFTWQPSWVIILIFFGLLPYIFVSLILTKRRKVSVPFCEEHKNHWNWRTIAIVASFAGVAAVWVAAVLLPSYLRGGPAEDPLGGALCLAAVLLPVPWLIAALIIQNSAIQATEITDNSITLRYLAKEFVDAYEEVVDNEYHRGVDRPVRDEWRQPDRRRAGDPEDKIRQHEPPRPPNDAYERR